MTYNKLVSKRYYQKKRDNPGFIKKKKQCTQKWRKLHKEYIKDYRTRYYQEHQMEIREQRKNYYLKNKDRENKYSRDYHKRIYPKVKESLIEYQKKYRSTERGKEVSRKKKSKRRKLGYIPLMNNFLPDNIPIEWHHINNFFVIPIPKYIHQKTLGLNHKEKCGKWIKKYYNIDVKEYDY